jgi:hypothetical protein
LNQTKQNSSNKVAEKNYEPSDYKSKTELNAGLAVTHEQVSDTWAEGNSDAIIDDLNGKSERIPRTGYQK